MGQYFLKSIKHLQDKKRKENKMKSNIKNKVKIGDTLSVRNNQVNYYGKTVKVVDIKTGVEDGDTLITGKPLEYGDHFPLFKVVFTSPWKGAEEKETEVTHRFFTGVIKGGK